MLISVLWKKSLFWSKLSEVSWLIFEFQLEIWAHTWVAWRQNGLFWEELHFIKFCNSFSGIYQWNQMELNWRSLSLMSLSSQSKISFKLQLYYYRGKLVKEKSLYKSCINFSWTAACRYPCGGIIIDGNSFHMYRQTARISTFLIEHLSSRLILIPWRSWKWMG